MIWQKKKTYPIKSLGVLLTLGLLYRHVTLLPLILIVTFSALIFTNAILKNMKMMKVYISGKIDVAVISEATRQKFARAEEMLKAKGYQVFNPCDERWQKLLKREYENDSYVKSPWMTDKFPDFYTYCLLRDMMVLSTKDAIYVLADWTQSDSANVEIDFARAASKRFFWEAEDDAKIFCDESGNYMDVWLPIQ